MKVLTCCALMAISKSPVEAQALRGIADAKVGVDEGFAIAERGPHHRVWSKTTWTTNRLGKAIAQVSSYTELETGMHVLKEGRWVDASPEITITAEGAAATDGAHQVRFAANLRSTNAVVLTTSDGKMLRSWIAGLAYFDESTGKSVLLGRLQDSIGQLYSPSRVVYPDAFDALEVDVEYINTKSGLEQNLILRAQPPSPEKWNLNPATTRLQVLTEFFDPPTPTEVKALRAAVDGDKTLNFGAMRMGRGKAFMIGDEAANDESIPVAKRWVTTSAGRTFLIEEVKFNPLSAGAQSLPTSQRTAKTAPSQIGGGDSLLATLQQVLPPAQSVRKSGVMRMAKLESRGRPGYVVDYTFLAGATDFTFKGDSTYYCTNSVNLNGTTTFEGGTVIKFSTNTTACLNLSGTIECRTGPYRPAVFTTRDDDTVGETISGSSGVPLAPGLSGKWLNINDSDNTAKHFRFSYASSGVNLGFSAGQFQMTHMQFVGCRYGLNFDGHDSDTVLADNCLFYITTNAFKGGVDNFVKGQHLTVNRCDKFWSHSGSSNGELYLTNSLLVDITSGLGSFDVSVQDHSPLVTGGAGVFQTVGSGAHYLIDGSTNRNAGTTNISTGLWVDLRTKTTYPPIVCSNSTTGGDMTLYPQAQRDTDVPDLGYHYDPLDYAFGFLRFTNGTMTVAPGTAVGCFSGGSTYSLALLTGAKLSSKGTVTSPNWIARYNSVQEQANRNWTNYSGFGDYTILGNWWGGTAPEINCRFTKFSALADRSIHFSDVYQDMPIGFTDCEFHGGNVSVSTSSFIATNCLFNRVYTYLSDENATVGMTVRDSTFFGGRAFVIHYDIGDFMFRNNLFALSTNYQDGDIDGDWNGYTTGTTRFTPNGAHDVPPTSLTFKAGPLGLFYLPSSSSFIDAGSTSADLFGLYHYATTTNLVSGLQVKETTSTVDMGYHYVALNSSNLPIDTDGDGMPDYLEDVNGDGSTYLDPTAWDSYNSPNGLSSGSGLQVFTPLK